MTLIRPLLLGSICLVGMPLLANAQQPQYQSFAYPYNQLAQQPRYQPDYNQAPSTPPSWSYDPYTSGLGPCPQHSPNDSLSCSEQIPPTYGQPDYWSR